MVTSDKHATELNDEGTVNIVKSIEIPESVVDGDNDDNQYKL